MLRIGIDESRPYCDGRSRRSFLQLGMAGMGALSLGTLARAREASAANALASASAGGAAASGRNASVILIWLDGGPSHMDTYDMKPEAPPEYRGLWKPIKTNADGIEVTELFPLQARLADKFSIIRSLHHNQGDHFTGGHYMLTGRGGASGAENSQKYPFVGAIATSLSGPRKPGMPAHAAVPYASSIGLRPGYFGAHYVGIQHNPFETVNDANTPGFHVPNIQSPGDLTVSRLSDRQGLSKMLDRLRREADQKGTAAAMDRFDQAAFDMVSGAAARRAFNVDAEDPRVRDRYGRHSWGQSTLLARRLVEAGTTFVTVHLGGWDHHWDLKAGYERVLPMVDQLVAGLIEDLDQRGMLETTLVLLCGEFSRTPRMNDGGNGGAPMSMGTPGRDHWGSALSCFIAGGGVQGGRVVGSTNRLGEVPKDRPVTPSDLHHTMFHLMGVDRHAQFVNHAGRPVPALEPGDVLRELL
jgi:hypothetical protein